MALSKVVSFTIEAFVDTGMELPTDVEFSTWLSSDSGNDGEGRNRTVSFPGGVAMMYDTLS